MSLSMRGAVLIGYETSKTSNPLIHSPGGRNTESSQTIIVALVPSVTIGSETGTS